MHESVQSRRRVVGLALLAASMAGGCETLRVTPEVVASTPRPIVIAHRGASGYRPEHTLAAYSTGILQGADFVELDLVSTSDGHLIARHDNVLDLTTDVASLPRFADRRRETIVDGRSVEGWFSEDFTLEEIRKLSAIERIPEIRPANATFDGHYGVPTLEEAIAVVQTLEAALRREIGLYIELKHPSHFDALGLPMEEPLARILRAHGYSMSDDGVFLQSFEIDSLRRLDDLTDLPLVQLLAGSGQPADVAVAGGTLTYRAMASSAGLREIAAYADGVGPDKHEFLIPRTGAGTLALGEHTDFVKRAHAAGLLVHPYTFRAENRFLPADLRSSSNDLELGEAECEIAAFLELGIDGFFVDQPDIGVAARDRHMRGR